MIEEITSRVFYVRRDGKIDVAYSNDGEQQVPNGRCLTLARVELADSHPEIDNQLDWDVVTTWTGIYFSKPKQGASGKPISFERLIQREPIELIKPVTEVARQRAESRAHPLETQAIREILGDCRFNINARVYSEFDGYWEAFGNRFNKIKTYFPLVLDACREVAEFRRLS